MRPIRHYALNAIVACGMLLLPLPFSSQAAALETSEWVDAENLYSHVERISRIPRPPATETEFAAGVYVENTLRSYGYKTTLQPFYYYTYKKPSNLSLAIEGWPEQKWNPLGFTFGPNGNGVGSIVDSGEGTASDFSRTDSEGKIAFVKRGTISFGEKVRQAAAAGAVAVIMWNDRDEKWKGSLGEPLDMAVPVIALSKEQGRILHDRLQADGELKGSIKVDGGLTSRQTSYNIIATREPSQGNTGQAVMVSAHHDSAPSSAGANNGASGVAVLLETARLLADRPSDTELRLVSFGAVSSGDRGPQAYAESLSDGEKRKIVAAFCLDGVGSQSTGELIVASENGKQNLPASLAVQAGAHYFAKWKARGHGFGDHRRLASAGIPAALLTKEGKEPAEDTLDHISRESLSSATQVLLSAITEITGTHTSAFPQPSANQPRGITLSEEEYQ